MLKKYSRSFTLMVAVMFLLSFTGSVFAASITGYVSGSAETGYYEYNTQDILNSYIYDDNQVLYKDYIVKGPKAYNCADKYVDIAAAVNDFIYNDTPIASYAEKPDATLYTLPNTIKQASIIDGVMVYTDKVIGAIEVTGITATKTMGQFKFNTSAVTTTAALTGKIKANDVAITEISPKDDTGKYWVATIPGAAYDTDYVITFEAPFTAQAATVKWAAPVVLPTIESIAATNSTTIQASFATGADIDETKLAGKTISLTAGEVSLTATYVASSLASGKANFNLATSQTLVDATTYTASADWAQFTNATFVAKVIAPYVKSIVPVTTQIIPQTYQGGATPSGITTIYFAAKDQYGANIDASAQNMSGVTVSGTLNEMGLLVTTEVAFTAGNQYVELKKTLVANDIVTVTFTKTVGQQIVTLGSLNYTVAPGTASVATTFTVTANKTSIAAKESITLTAVLRDQYNNPMNIGNGTIRWVLKKAGITEQTVDGNGTQSFTLNSAGEYTVQAFVVAKSTLNQTVSITVGPVALSTLTCTTENPGAMYNQDTYKVYKIEQNTGAILTPEMIKFKITPKTDGTTVDDITVSAALRGGTTNASDIVISIKTTKTGTYEIIPYVGTSFTDVNKVAASGFSVTTNIDQTVKTIDDITFTDTELKTGKDITKEVTFKNKHGEIVVPAVQDVSIGIVPSAGLTASAIVADGKFKVTFKADQAKTYNVTIAKGDIFKAYTLTFVGPTITTINPGANITGVVAGDPESLAKYQPVKFLDQDGIEMNVAKSGLVVTVTTPGGTDLANAGDLVNLCKTYAVTNGVATGDLAGDSDNVVAIKVLPKVTLAQGTYTVKIATTPAGVSGTFTVAVGAARKVNSLSVDKTSATMAVGASQEFILKPVDQYGAPITTTLVAISSSSTVAEAPTEFKGIDSKGNVTSTPAAIVGYKTSITAVAKGNATITFTATPAAITATTVITVDSIGSLVDSVVIDKTTLKSLYSTETTNAAINLGDKVKAYNASQAQIPISPADIGWTVANVTPATGSTGTAIVNTAGVATADKGFKGTATIKAQVGLKSDTVTLNFSNAAPTPVAGTTTIYNAKDIDSDSSTEGIQIAINGKSETNAPGKDGEKNGVVAIQLEAQDQYGNIITPVSFTPAELSVVTDDSSVLEINTSGSAIIIAAKTVGTAHVVINYKGDEIVLAVTVTQDGVAAATKYAIANATFKCTQLTVNVSGTAITVKQSGVTPAAIGAVTVNIPMNVVISDVVATNTSSGAIYDLNPLLKGLGISLPLTINKGIDYTKDLSSTLAELKVLADKVTCKINEVDYTVIISN